ncbi:hypothetical protein ES332_D05G242400v1 [Gossypium tomentosum]|uniref:Uncharacterized protein n=1 Tax=Gossypium tomentosum TaxID=34277 RepID=A0A5D2KZL8_GOSTO|nr:hypothetical protein ES332_D05G242400v1 [Gossypium tomentosum]
MSFFSENLLTSRSTPCIPLCIASYIVFTWPFFSPERKKVNVHPLVSLNPLMFRRMSGQRMEILCKRLYLCHPFFACSNVFFSAERQL